MQCILTVELMLMLSIYLYPFCHLCILDIIWIHSFGRSLINLSLVFLLLLPYLRPQLALKVGYHFCELELLYSTSINCSGIIIFKTCFLCSSKIKRWTSQPVMFQFSLYFLQIFVCFFFFLLFLFWFHWPHWWVFNVVRKLLLRSS